MRQNNEYFPKVISLQKLKVTRRPVPKARDGSTTMPARKIVYTDLFASLCYSPRNLSNFVTKSIWENFQIHSFSLADLSDLQGDASRPTELAAT
jgi:hypothetical protein